jgi:hypothetical protein
MLKSNGTWVRVSASLALRKKCTEIHRVFRRCTAAIRARKAIYGGLERR